MEKRLGVLWGEGLAYPDARKWASRYLTDVRIMAETTAFDPWVRGEASLLGCLRRAPALWTNGRLTLLEALEAAEEADLGVVFCLDGSRNDSPLGTYYHRGHLEGLIPAPYFHSIKVSGRYRKLVYYLTILLEERFPHVRYLQVENEPGFNTFDEFPSYYLKAVELATDVSQIPVLAGGTGTGYSEWVLKGLPREKHPVAVGFHHNLRVEETVDAALRSIRDSVRTLRAAGAQRVILDETYIGMAPHSSATKEGAERLRKLLDGALELVDEVYFLSLGWSAPYFGPQKKVLDHTLWTPDGPREVSTRAVELVSIDKGLARRPTSSPARRAKRIARRIARSVEELEVEIGDLVDEVGRGMVPYRGRFREEVIVRLRRLRRVLRRANLEEEARNGLLDYARELRRTWELRTPKGVANRLRRLRRRLRRVARRLEKEDG